MGSTKRHHKNESKLFYCIGLLLFLSIGGACTGFESLSTIPESRRVSPAQGMLGLESDKLQAAYSNFLMASLNDAYGDFKQARDYLIKAMENDPDSFYLNQKMVTYLKKMKDY